MNLLIPLLALSSSVITPDMVTQLSELEKNDPHQALKVYKQSREDYLRSFSLEAVQYHRVALKAANDLTDWPTFLSILETLKQPELTPYTSKKTLHIINDIGVAYRLNNQFDDAIAHFKCAIDKTSNAHQTAALKANIAIAYRIQGQPSVGFRLLDSIEFKVLNTPIRAGINVVKGNLSLHLGKTTAAIQSYQEAIKLFKEENKIRDSIRVEFNIMTAALLEKNLPLYQTYRTNAETKIKDFNIDNSDFLTFLDMVSHAISTRDTVELETSKTALLLNELAKNDDANESVRLLLKSLKLDNVISAEQQRKPIEPLLEAKLGAHWCEEMK